MTKKITMQTRPNIKPEAEDWVENKSPNMSPQAPSSQEAIKRLTVGVGESLHRKLKIYCATEGTDIATVVRELISGRVENAN